MSQAAPTHPVLVFLQILFAGFPGVASIVTLAIIVVALLKSVLLVRQGEVVIVERLGQFNGVKHAGLHLLVPFVDQTHTVHWTRRVEKREGGGRAQVVSEVHHSDRITLATVAFDIPPVQCTTQERIEVAVNIVVYYRVTDVQKAVYGVQDLYAGIELKVETLLLGMVHDISLDNLTTRALQHEMAKRMAEESWPAEWGLHIERFEVQSVDLPRALKEATLKTVTQRRADEAERYSDESARQKQLTALETQALVAAKTRAGEMATMQHALDTQRMQNELANEKARADADTNAYSTRTQDQATAERYRAKYKAMKESGMSEAFFTAQQHSKATRALLNAGITGSNKTIVLPYEALAGGNALLTTRLLCPEQQVMGMVDMGAPK